jgi:hypothetical protein
VFCGPHPTDDLFFAQTSAVTKLVQDENSKTARGSSGLNILTWHQRDADIRSGRHVHLFEQLAFVAPVELCPTGIARKYDARPRRLRVIGGIPSVRK